jgi:hypothetical protein
MWQSEIDASVKARVTPCSTTYRSLPATIALLDHPQHGPHLQGLHARPIIVTLNIHIMAAPRKRPFLR